MRRSRGVLTVLVVACSLFASAPIKAETRGETVLSNEQIMREVLPSESAPDIILGEGNDLLQVTLDQLGPLPKNAVVAPLIIPAADFNGDSQTSDYFFSFGSALYNLTDGCHMAPAYLPHGGGGTTVTVNNFFIFAVDNNAGADVTFNLWRKNTLNTSSPQILGTVATTGASTNMQILGDTTIDNAVVTADYAYYVTWCYTGANEAVQGFWIYYTEAAP